MIRILLIRHAAYGKPGAGRASKDMPLSPEGQKQTRSLAANLTRLEAVPDLVLTSAYEHSQEMARLLSGELGIAAEPAPLAALTPHDKTSTLEDALFQARQIAAQLGGRGTVALVGHEGRLSNLLARLTGRRYRPFLVHAEVVSVTGPSWLDLLRGRGEVEFRYPVVDYQEAELRPKIVSKMTVSTFLAGFTFTALMLLLQLGVDSFWRLLAALLLIAALVLFLAAIYIYDRLSMPEGLWIQSGLDGSAEVAPGPPDAVREYGPLYFYMIATWGRFFTPAVWCLILGFLALLVASGNRVLMAAAPRLVLLGLVLYETFKPRLGVD